MKFDEAETKVENLVGDLNIPLGVEGSLLDIIDKLREEYAPTVEMTEIGKNYLLYYLENSSFGSFISDINLVRSGTIGVKSTDYFEDLSDEELMQAWLHPDKVKVVDELKQWRGND